MTLNLSNNSGSLPSGRLSSLSQHSEGLRTKSPVLSDKDEGEENDEEDDGTSDWDSWDEEDEVCFRKSLCIFSYHLFLLRFMPYIWAFCFLT